MGSLCIDEAKSPYVRGLARELGIVLLAVFTVSLIYELALAKKYVKHFLVLLRGEIERGETNAAVCERLGIRRIYPARNEFEQAFPLERVISGLTTGSRLRIVAKSLFLVMGKPHTIKSALERGARVELCIMNPTSCAEISKVPDLVVEDIYAAIAVFRREIAEWVVKDKPPGTLELRYHMFPMWDSYLYSWNGIDGIAVWDLSFGRDVTRKRIFLLEPNKTMDRDLSSRYDNVWSHSSTEVVFEYAAQCVNTNKL